MSEVAPNRWLDVPHTTGSRSGRDRSRRVLVIVELATGGSALICGGLLAMRPDGSLMGLPTRVLVEGPFTDWRLPGLLLAGFVGVGYLTAATSQRWRYAHTAELGVLAGAGLVLFEAVEWAWLGFHPLQAVFMAVGAGVIALAAAAGNPPAHRPPSREIAGGARNWSA